MSRARRLCLSVGLVLTFAVSAFAGEIECGYAPPPPPPPTVTEVIVSLLPGLLSLF